MPRSKRVVARWETRGNDFLQLEADENGYTYKGKDCGGSLPKCNSDEEAIVYMEKPWGLSGAGPVTVLRIDRPSLKRIF